MIDFITEHWVQTAAALWLIGLVLVVLFVFCAGSNERNQS